MILDERTEFADATALNTGAAGDYVIGDVVDLGAAGRDIGNGEELELVVQVDTTATSGGSATLAISLATDDNSSLSSPTKVVTSPAVAVASLTAGTTVFRVHRADHRHCSLHGRQDQRLPDACIGQLESLRRRHLIGARNHESQSNH